MAARAVLFDLDDTLHDRQAALDRFIEAQHTRHQLADHNIPLEGWRADFRRLEKNGRVWKDVVYEDLHQIYSVPIAASELLREYTEGFALHAQPRPGMVDLLTDLRQDGWCLGVITNGPTTFQESTINALNLRSYVDTVVISQACGLRKPDPAIFALALEQIGAKAEDSWFVGDDLTADIGGAQGAGLRPIWFEQAGKSAPLGIPSINELGQIPALINAKSARLL